MDLAYDLILNMKIPWLMIWIGALFSNPVKTDCNITSLSVTCEESAKNYSSIPTSLKHENDTLCAYPDVWNKSSIKTAPIQKSDCDSRRGSIAITTPSTSAISPKIISILTSSLNSSNNNIRSNASYPGSPPLGKSWVFLLGVLVFVLSSSLLIFIAIKFPLWYLYLISYNHRRLKEYEPEMFDKEFTTDLSTSPSISNTNEQDSIVVFEQTHTFVLDEDGFIEDKYIDDPGLTEEV
ncbi:leucine-rich repeat-containing protein 19 isoform X4 [Malaclemys terrapin pileata]|uniref:leucine-rich repeat-containing protein 19 isoform X4 n=1 Tax=Malaclemys terrapin pileata TaxID=2991368 RepID=UPI0023A89D83|nr:leucine-rich repeat-containing protein 19 isoform X4 [Malaclemys terrapin pileata]